WRSRHCRHWCRAGRIGANWTAAVVRCAGSRPGTGRVRWWFSAPGWARCRWAGSPCCWHWRPPDRVPVLPALAAAGPVVAYDRAGLGASDPVQPLTLRDEVEDLAAVLAEVGPAVVVGHSW